LRSSEPVFLFASAVVQGVPRYWTDEPDSFTNSLAGRLERFLASRLQFDEWQLAALLASSGLRAGLPHPFWGSAIGYLARPA